MVLSMTANEVSQCSSALTCERICLTSQPCVTSASAISEAMAAPASIASAHMIAVFMSVPYAITLFKGSLKFVRLHIVGIAAKTGITPSVV